MMTISAKRDAEIIEAAIKDATAHIAKGVYQLLSPEHDGFVAAHFILEDDYRDNEPRWRAVYRAAYNHTMQESRNAGR